MSAPALLPELALRMARGAVRVVDLTQTLSPSFPALQLPPQFGQVQAFKIERISHYDEAGPGWYWNNFSCGEHTGTHFDAPVHWISGRDHPANSVDTIARALHRAGRGAGRQRRGRAERRLAADRGIHPGLGTSPRPHPAARLGAAAQRLVAARAGSGRLPQPARGRRAHARPDAGSRAMADPRARRARLRVETINTDAGQSHAWPLPYPCHTLMHGANRYGLQCLKNLDQLPPQAP